MAVGPHGLEGVTTDMREAHELERLRSERPIRAAMHHPHHVGLAATTGTGTVLAQRIEPDEAFAPVIPLDRQLFANLLNVRRSHITTLRLSVRAIQPLNSFTQAFVVQMKYSFD